MKLSIDFAFEGFRIVRQRPFVILLWGFVLLIGMVLGYGSFFAMAGSQLLPLIDAIKAGENANHEQIVSIVAAVFPALLVAVVIVSLFQIVLKCAIFRMSFGTKDTSFGGLRFGSDELRLIGASLLYFIVALGVEIGLALGSLIVTTVLTMGFNAISPGLGGLGVFITIILRYGLQIWFICKMSLFSAQTFDEKRVNVFGSWTLTNGNFWPLLLGYIVAGVMLIVVYILCAVVFGTGFVVLSMSHPLPQFSSPADVFKAWQSLLPFVILGGLALWIIMPLIMTITYGAPAAAYRQLTGNKRGAANVF